MNIATIIKRNQRDLLTLRPEDTIQTAASIMATNRIGAMPVRDPQGHLIGILSERDIVRGLHKRGGDALNLRVGDLMTADVKTCSPDDDVRDALEVMSSGHFRHMPVVENGELVGMVSQGDVVKLRLEQSEMETGIMRDIALTRR